MTNVVTRDLQYRHDSTTMLGYYCVGTDIDGPRPGVLMIHGGFGLVPRIMDNAEHLAALGYAVLAVDLWGDRHQPATPSEFVPLIAALTQDRPRWLARIDAARDVLVSQPDAAPVGMSAVGYCFGGSSVLEYARAGRTVSRVVSLHGGLDNVGLDWSACEPATSILILTGADDPMATSADLHVLHRAMTEREFDWEIDVYGGTNHGFTFPDSPNYDERSDRRSWAAMTRALAELNSTAD